MKQLDEIMITETQLGLICGKGNCFFHFPTQKGKGNKDRKLPASAKAIINYVPIEKKGSTQQTIGKIQSFDSRFDKKHPLIIAIDDIRANGIRPKILAEIYNDSSCIKMGRLMGKYKVFNDILSDQQRRDIEFKLVKIFQYKQEEEERAKIFFS